MKDRLFRKGLVAGVIFLFLGISIFPSIYADTDIYSIQKTNKYYLKNEISTIKCRYYTIDGVEEIEKEVNIEDSENLSHLIYESNYNVIASKMKSLGLIPELVSIDEAQDLMSGEYGKREMKRYENKLKEFTLKDSKSDIMENTYCSISGEALDSWNRALWSIPYIGFVIALIYLDEKLLELFPSYPEIFEFWYSPVGILGAIGMGLFVLHEVLRPFVILKLNAYLYGGLQYNVIINTSGNFGKKSLIESTKSVLFYITGFVGIWIEISDNTNEPGCKFMGFSLYARALSTD